MMLRPCNACGRHVRAESDRCPFCDAALPAFEPAPPRARPLGQITRAAIFAGTALLLAPGCGSSHDDSDNIAQPYGAPPNDTGGDESMDGTQDDGSGGVTDDGTGGDGTDTDTDDGDVGIAPPYGSPPAYETV